MVADGALDVHQVLDGEVGNGDEYNVKADDDQRADGYIGNDSRFPIVKGFASVQDTKEKAEVCWIEQHNVQHVLTSKECLKMPMKEQYADSKTHYTGQDVVFDVAPPE